ncbi:stalk domain-containing protein [Ammoniphilus resinae]|uniref:GH18 domain-containing protein n=1 Tax=Ammoniphilus resinae TaxID=861532 RepID=A0ABS4GU12_9BACL|nr:stalk domain-containing protein [Ammoniphilus resinae]MBP1933766.1 hypothetical protein [Ammoniphilus resinae]
MKKSLLAIPLALALLSGSMSSATAAEDRKNKVVVDGAALENTTPLILNGRSFVPFRALAEALDVTVTWNDKERTVNAISDDVMLELTIGSKQALTNQGNFDLDAAPMIKNGKTYIPLRFFAETFDAKVTWDPENQSIYMTTPPAAMAVIGFYTLGDAQTSSWTDLFTMDYPGTGIGNTDLVSELALGWYSMDEEGNLLPNNPYYWNRPADWESVLGAAGDYRMKTEMTIHLPEKDPTLLTLLTDEQVKSQAITQIVKEVELYDGVNLDLEGLGLGQSEEQIVKTQSQFTRFVSDLSEQLRSNNKSLTLTLHAPNSVYKGYDYKSLGGVADQIIIMAYDYTDPKSQQPEPLNKVEQAVELAKAVVPAEKLVLAINLWKEDEETIQDKIAIAKRHHLKGIALWRLGLVQNDWNGIRQQIKKRY